MTKQKIAIQHGLSLDKDVLRMFIRRGFEVDNFCGLDSVNADPKDYDLLVFTGGSDVSPWLYGEVNVSSRYNPRRDQADYFTFRRFNDENIPMAGICRGGQFLNVVHGGKMIQDVHGFVGMVGMQNVTTGFCMKVQVGHHQGIIPSKDGVLRQEGYSGGTRVAYDVRYKEGRIFCFQPHPEWGHKPTEDYFFGVLGGVL